METFTMFEKVQLEGQPEAMELDMGSTMLVMSEGVYQK